MASGDISKRDCKQASSVINDERRDRYKHIKAYLKDIEFCLEHWGWQSKFNKERVLHLLNLIEEKAHEENNFKIQGALENGLINKTMPFGAEIRRNGLTQYALTLFDQLKTIYRQLYSEERKRQYVERKTADYLVDVNGGRLRVLWDNLDDYHLSPELEAQEALQKLWHVKHDLETADNFQDILPLIYKLERAYKDLETEEMLKDLITTIIAEIELLVEGLKK